MAAIAGDRVARIDEVGLAHPATRTLFVKIEHMASWTEVMIRSDMSVARVTAEIVKVLKLTDHLSTVTLHRVHPDTDLVSEVALDGRWPILRALPTAADNSVVVRVARTVVPAGAFVVLCAVHLRASLIVACSCDGGRH